MKSKVTWKRIGSLFLAVCMVLTMLPTMAFAAAEDELSVDNLKYKVLTEDAESKTGTVALIGYESSGPTGKLTVTEAVYKEDVGINYTVTEIGKEAFEFCGDITEVEIPDSVETIGDGAFHYCKKLATIILGEGIKTMGNEAFASTGITSVSIPASVATIGQEAFAQCSDLTGFTVDSGNTEFSAEDGVLYNKDKSTLVQYPPGKSLVGFTFPNSVKTIGSYAFAYMDGNSETLTIGNSVETIEDNAFSSCGKLSKMTIGSGVKSIGDDTFYDCDNLEEVTFAPDSVLETIGERTFGNCIFTEFTIPDTVSSIGNDAFGYCDNLASISISENVVSLGGVPFYVNRALESIDVAEDNVNYSSKNGVLYNKSGDTLLRYPANKPATEFTIPNGVTTLGDSSFYGNNNLKKLIIPSSVNKIEEGTFYWAKALEDIRFLGETPPTIGEDSTFSNTDKLANIYVPKGTVEAYKSALSSVLSSAGKNTGIIREYTIPGAIEVTNAEELKSALVSNIPSAILVTTDINMGNTFQTIEVGADHTLHIEDGKTVSTGEAQITIPEDKTLTVDGTLKLTEGSKLEANGSIEGMNSGRIILEEGANIEGVANVFMDRGYRFRGYSYITVIAEDGIPTRDTLTAGEYVWDGLELFEKEGEIDWDKGYGLVIAGVRVDDNNAGNITGNMIDGIVSYDRNTKTLTLKDAEIIINDNDDYEYGIYSSDDITIKLEGNSIIGTMVTVDYNTYYGIYAPGKDISIIGNGNLNIYDEIMGILGKDITLNSTGNLIIKEHGGSRACCLKADGGALTINSGNLNLSSTISNGLYGDSIVINSGSITAQSESGRAFNIAPLFSPNYKCTIRTGTSPSDVRETSNPTFAEKYIRIEPKTSGGSNNGGGNTGGGSTRPTQPTNPTIDGSVKVEYTISDGTASLSITNTKANDIIAKAKNGEAVLNLQSAKHATAVNIPKNALSSFEKADLDLVVKLPEGTATIDNKALASILGKSQGTADMKLELKQISSNNLSADQKESVKKGDLVFDINILMGAKNITEFDGALSIDVPYNGELPVAVWYLNDKGELEKLEASYSNGVVSFVLNHLSLYVVGKDEAKTEVKWDNPFADVKEDSWFYEAVKYVYKNDLMKGTGGNTFSPNGVTTRGMIVTILHRLEGSPSANASRFSDVKADKYYVNAVDWASESKIVNGYGNGKFGPEDAITREQLAAILMNYAKYKGYDVTAKADLSKFGDSKEISNWAKDAISRANAEGLIQGDGNNLIPIGNATRAQVAAILNRFVEKIVK